MPSSYASLHVCIISVILLRVATWLDIIWIWGPIKACFQMWRRISNGNVENNGKETSSCGVGVLLVPSVLKKLETFKIPRKLQSTMCIEKLSDTLSIWYSQNIEYHIQRGLASESEVDFCIPVKLAISLPGSITASMLLISTTWDRFKRWWYCRKFGCFPKVVVVQPGSAGMNSLLKKTEYISYFE